MVNCWKGAIEIDLLLLLLYVAFMVYSTQNFISEYQLEWGKCWMGPEMGKWLYIKDFMLSPIELPVTSCIRRSLAHL